MVRSLLTLASMAAMATMATAQITFNVVGYPKHPTNAFAVSINGQQTRMATNETMTPVWFVHVPSATNGTQYHYVEVTKDGAVVEEEAFVRTANVTAKRMATEHQFFQRPLTKHEIPRLPYTYLATYPTNSKAFKENQIATFHITGTVAEIDRLNANPNQEIETKVTVRYINAKTIHTQTNITFKTSGKSSKEFAKQSYKLEFDDKYGQSFFHRPNIKLRALATTEPSMIRERLYIDMLNSVGVPTAQGTYVRLFINNKPYGLYLMVDDIKKSFLKQTVHGGMELNRGSLVQMNAWKQRADLTFRGPTSAPYLVDELYKSQNLGNNPETDPLKELIQFIQDLEAFNPTTTPNPVQYFNDTRLDLDGFLRSMALEYLFGAFDNYWISASNYFMYKNPTLAMGGKWQWLPTDFDGIIGVGKTFPVDGTYQTFYDFKEPRPLVQKLIIENPQIRGLFEETLKNIVSTAFKPEAMNAHIEGLQKMLSQDAEWDLSLPRMSPGTNHNFTFAEFNANFDSPNRIVGVGIKPWISGRANGVAAALGFQIPAGTADRIPPPPRKDPDADDEEPDMPEDGSGKSGSGNGRNSAPSLKQASGLVTLLAVVASAVLLA
ncbi:hypothetical protein BGW41_002370 [Actinomortierella wolfii]|nr:hypothetical protein BGW41_002370 [Actinomortierella wolfii]